MLTIDKEEYKTRYNQKLLRVMPEFQKQYGILDDTYIVSEFTGQTYRYEIDKILKLSGFYNEFMNYINSLKAGDYIKEKKWFKVEEGKIKRINRKQKTGKISSLTIEYSFVPENSFQSITSQDNMEIQKIVYNNVMLKDLVNAVKHFTYYLFFDSYVINDAELILQEI